ncbi:ATP-binding cassette sub-family C member 4-like isoform X1 [Rhynchophorus ferrugineus]|uniref:ATP-binding cassette sub-family C member 4-like isoform X1 n=4 Tax=Rhynchophorus ferrugineus TaxID=354439 RepID=UPI003FCD7D23
MKKNPYETSGLVSKIAFAWTFPLFRKGFVGALTEDDIYPHLKSHDSAILGDKLEREWKKQMESNKKNPSLWKALFKIFGRDLMIMGTFILIYEMIRISLPLTLSKLLDYFDPQVKMSLNDAYFYAGMVSLTTLVQVFVIHHTMLHVFHMGVRMRAACAALVYRKAIRLSKTSLVSTTVGQMVNLISNDVSRFEVCTINVHNIWIAPIELFVILYLLYTNVGWTGLPGVGILLCFIPFQMWMGKKTSLYRLRTAIKTDERIRVMNEIISGIQVIKMYTWEKPFAHIVEVIRRSEMSEIRKNSVIKALTMSLNIFLTRVLIFICILVFTLRGNVLNAKYVYVLSLMYELLRQGVSHAFAQGITQLAEASISVKRIKQFLMYDEIYETDHISNHKQPTKVSSKDKGVVMENVSTKWVKSSSDNSLEQINFKVVPGELVAVIGKVGSGKTTLLQVILKELPPDDGSLVVNGSVSYASQEPWLFVGTARDNILFGAEYDVVKYQEVVRVCALQRDFALLPNGDKTLIGERGTSLSGGQRARINLARAIYRDADIYLLDDPLSAVDAHVGKQIYRHCINDYLKDKCVVLVTHQLQYLKGCKNIYLLSDGRVDYSGTYEEMENSGKEFTKLLEEFKRVEEENKKEETEARKRLRTLSTTSCGNFVEETIIDPVIDKESTLTGKVTWNVYKSYLQAGGHIIKFVSLVFFFVVSQALASGTDYFLSIWVNWEQQNQGPIVTNNMTENVNLIDTTLMNRFNSYLSESDGFLTIYAVLIVIVAVMLISRAILFFRFCITASINLHNNMFSKIVYASMRFFFLNPSGRILNRFSKDMNLVDEWLPVTISDTLQIGLMMASISVVVAVVTPIMLIPTGLILTIFYLIRIVFIRTSREIKRLEAATRSPVYSHLTASLQGLTTIRAFGAQEMLKQQFDNYQDVYSSTYFMFIATTRAFGYWLDLHTVIFVVLVTFSFLFLKTDAFGGSVGLAITQAISLTGWFQYGIRQWSEMENTMTSVERIKEYADVVPEVTFTDKPINPPNNWPQTGRLAFQDVSLRYSKDGPKVLNNISFSIRSGEKVGIVGRTGAGKSSIISALFRLANIEGKIIIDDVNTQHIPLNCLRSNLSIIPQEPVLFAGSVRKNLDPFDEYKDEEIWNALTEVELKEAVADLPCGLESNISEGGSNFSVGQRQLICLSRAILRKNTILILDEATASVDPHTDAMIQATIRKSFRECTVLTIAHRLHTVMDSDKILVMDAGRMAEYGHPFELLRNKNGIFSVLVRQTGRAMAGNLLQIAEKTYHEKGNHPEETI